MSWTAKKIVSMCVDVRACVCVCVRVCDSAHNCPVIRSTYQHSAIRTERQRPRGFTVRFDSFARLAGGHIQQGDGSVLGGKRGAGAIRVDAGAQHVLAAAIDGVGFGFGVHIPHTDLALKNSKAKLKEVNKRENKMQLTTMPCTQQLIQSCVRVPTKAPRLQRPPVQHSDACA